MKHHYGERHDKAKGRCVEVFPSYSLVGKLSELST